MIVCGDSINKILSEDIAKKIGAPIFYPEILVFPDSEQRVRVPEEQVTGQDVYVVKSITAPVDSSLVQLSFIVDAMKRCGAKKIIGIVPYIPYMRADHIFRTGEAVPLAVVINMIESSGLDEIVIVDPHSIKIPEMFKIPVHNLSALGLFANKIKEIEASREGMTIVSPDMGGIRRLTQMNELLGGDINTVVINKDRDYSSGSIKVAEFKGEVKGACFIIDDIISTGKTIAQAVDTLIQNGATGVYVFATHPVLSEEAIDLLQNSNAMRVFVTNSIPVPGDKEFEKLEIMSVSNLIVGKIIESQEV